MIETSLDVLHGLLERKRFFAECLLHDLRLVRFGFGIDLVFNDVWDSGGQVRADVLDRPVLSSFRLLGVESLRLTGGLAPGMITRPDLVDWGLSEVARVEPGESAAGLRLSVLWEGARQIDIEFHSFELDE